MGQGKHLKLRLSKGPSRFDAIFFSMPEAAAQLEPGCRVDADFYLQANTFRGTTTLQLQLDVYKRQEWFYYLYRYGISCRR